jgi:molybdenum cofactor cytidylyltransferase
VKLKIGIIILAAGSSSRMGGESKQLLEFQGKTLLRRAALTALRTGCPTVTVLGAKQEIFRKEIEDLPLKIAVNENWQIGINSSIKSGLSALAEYGLDAAIVMLCDQPLVTSEVLTRLINSFTETKKPIAACSYENSIGVPALFARSIFDELNDLKIGEGAKKIIVKDFTRTVLIDVPEAAFDVDTLQDFENLINQLQKLGVSA